MSFLPSSSKVPLRRGKHEEPSVHVKRSTNNFSSSQMHMPVAETVGDGQHVEAGDDMALELYEVLSEAGKLQFRSRNFSDASKLLNRALDQAAFLGWDELDPQDRCSIQLRLAVSLYELGRLDESEEVLLSVIASQPLTTDNHLDAFLAAHILAQVCLALERVDEAEKSCKQALLRRKLTLGKAHKDYHESVFLFVSICNQKNDTDMAFAYGALLPPGFEPNPHSALYITNISAAPTKNNQAKSPPQGPRDVFENHETSGMPGEEAYVTSTPHQLVDDTGHNPPSYSEIVEQSPKAHDVRKACLETIVSGNPGSFSSTNPSAESERLAMSSLLTAGFDPQSMSDRDAYKAFRWACEEGNETVVQWLLPRIKDIDSVIDTGFREVLSALTGLHRASRAGHVGVVRLLVQRGANIEAEAGSRKTPLMLAASNGKDEVVRELLLLGAETLPKMVYEESALFQAIKNDHKACIRAILESPPECDIWHNHGAQELDKACRLGDPALIGMLLERGAKFKMQELGATLRDTGIDHLYRASRSNRADVVLVLLEAGVDVNGVSSGGTPLLAAAKAGYVDMVRLLIEHGARLNFKGRSSHTPLEKAQKHGNLEVVHILKESAEAARNRNLAQQGKLGA